MSKKEIDLYINSWGGVGTTSFMQFLIDNKFKVNSLSDIDSFKPNYSSGLSLDHYGSGIKHIPHPNHKRLEPYKIKRCIFIYDDIINSLISLWRRNFQCPQVRKLSHNKNTIPNEWALTDYIKNDQDLFMFQEMFNNWINTLKDYDCLFVKGQQIYKHRYHILKFLDMPSDSQFFEHHNRNSDWFSDLDKKTKEGLYNMYGGFNDYILSLPDIQLQKANSTELIQLTTTSNTIVNPFK
jgi:hypothetical protein